MPSNDPTHKGVHEESHNASLTEFDHGTFTKISYVIAWIVAIVGSIFGLFVVIEDDAIFPLFGLGIIVGSWGAASGIGTLAEISRKLTYMQSPQLKVSETRKSREKEPFISWGPLIDKTKK